MIPPNANNNIPESPIPECPGAPKRPPRARSDEGQGPRQSRTMSRRRLEFNFHTPTRNGPRPELPRAPSRPRLVRADPNDPERPRPAARRQLEFIPAAPRVNRTRSSVGDQVCSACKPRLVRRLFSGRPPLPQCSCRRATQASPNVAAAIALPNQAQPGQQVAAQQQNQIAPQDAPMIVLPLQPVSAQRPPKRPLGACSLALLDQLEEEDDDDTEDHINNDTEDVSDDDTKDDSDNEEEAENDDSIKRRRTC